MKKKFAPDQERGFIGDKPYTAPKRVYVEDSRITKYRKYRDDVLLSDLFVCEESKKEILSRYNGNSEI